MTGLMDDPGRLRPGGVGIYRGGDLVHMAPPASRVFELVQDLLAWLGRGELHPPWSEAASSITSSNSSIPHPNPLPEGEGANVLREFHSKETIRSCCCAWVSARRRSASCGSWVLPRRR